MAVKLDEYNQKRDFEKTGEPQGTNPPSGTEESPEGLQFVVQHHIARRDHFDFRLEWGGVLLSWAVPKGPSYDPREKRLAIQVEDHPLEYRNFEGTIPKGEYGGGTVMLWDEGIWEPQLDVKSGLADGSLKFTLYGRRLQGKWALVRMKPKKGETKDNWLLLKERDEYAKTQDDLSSFATSIRTGRTMTEIEKGEDEKLAQNPFDVVDVQLAKLVKTVPAGDDWLYELKYDGYRILAYLEGSSIRLITRNGNDFTNRFRDVAYSLLGWAAGRAMVLDGEMVITDDAGRSDFQALQSYMKSPGGKKLTYIIFDLLALDGADLRGSRLLERKERLEALMKNAPGNLYYSKHVQGNGSQSFRAACNLNMEGIVGKKADSVYSGTRNGDWIKLKCEKRQEFVIGGFTLSDKKTNGISSLLLGAYQGDALVYVGRAGTGFTQRSMRELREKFDSIIRDQSPFRQPPKPKTGETFTWLQPVLVAEIKFAEWTGENLLRQASFKGLRTDKDPRDIKIEEAEVETMSEETLKEEQPPALDFERPAKASRDTINIGGIRITSPDKVIFHDPQIKKADVVRYYAKVADCMLPFAGNRILSIVRCPKGISEACFFKKHPGPDNKAIVTIPVMTGSGKKEDYFYIRDAAGLISEAQMGTLEFHVWGSRVENLEKPDMMVFDLDPDEGMDLQQVRQGVRDVKSLLDQLSLISFLKTSGGKGYHVVVPFEPSAEWQPFYDFARRIAQVMEKQWPDRYTSNVRKDSRKNKIFIDWIRNGRGATSIAPYSIRARNGAGVSMPIAWEELDTVAPDGINMEEALKRVGGIDPWSDFYQLDQRLNL